MNSNTVSRRRTIPGPDWKNPANLLTVTRIPLGTLAMVSVLHRGYALAFSLLLLCALTDFFDGRIARQLGITSKMGAVLDVSSDIFCVLGVESCLVLLGEWNKGVIILLGLSVFVFAARATVAGGVRYTSIGKYLGAVHFAAILVCVSLLGTDWRIWRAIDRPVDAFLAAYTVAVLIETLWTMGRAFMSRHGGNTSGGIT